MIGLLFRYEGQSTSCRNEHPYGRPGAPDRQIRQDTCFLFRRHTSRKPHRSGFCRNVPQTLELHATGSFQSFGEIVLTMGEGKHIGLKG